MLQWVWALGGNGTTGCERRVDEGASRGICRLARLRSGLKAVLSMLQDEVSVLDAILDGSPRYPAL